MGKGLPCKVGLLDSATCLISSYMSKNDDCNYYQSFIWGSGVFNHTHKNCATSSHLVDHKSKSMKPHHTGETISLLLKWKASVSRVKPMGAEERAKKLNPCARHKHGVGCVGGRQ